MFDYPSILIFNKILYCQICSLTSTFLLHFYKCRPIPVNFEASRNNEGSSNPLISVLIGNLCNYIYQATLILTFLLRQAQVDVVSQSHRSPANCYRSLEFDSWPGSNLFKVCVRARVRVCAPARAHVCVNVCESACLHPCTPVTISLQLSLYMCVFLKMC